jgi:hypothetical protein
MKKISQQLEDILLDYIDGNLDALQREAIEKSIKESTDLKERYEELRLLHFNLKNQPLFNPSRDFTSAVMNKLDQYPSRAGLSLMNGVFLLSGIFIVLAIAVVLLSQGVFDQSTSFDLNNVGLVNQYIKQTLPSIPVNGKLIVNIIVLLNLGLAFIVLDKAILKPLFARRMHASH